jgi:hypothetical protein
MTTRVSQRSEVELPVAQRVVDQRATLLRREVGRADRVKNGKVFGVGTAIALIAASSPTP